MVTGGLSKAVPPGGLRVIGERRIKTRPFFSPMHTLPMDPSPAARGMNLLSSAGLTREDVAHVAERLLDLGNAKA